MREDDYPLLRSSLAPAYANASPAQLRSIVQAIYGPEVEPEDVEGLFDDIGGALKGAASSVGGFAQKAAPVLGKALPSVAQGAAAGSAFGPWGALIGGVAGGVSGVLQQSSDPRARAVGGAIHDVGSLASLVRGGGGAGGMGALGSIATGAMGGGAAPPMADKGGGAANGLMGALARPEVLQALLSGAMGAFGNKSVSVGGQQVPVQGMLSMLSTLAGRAAHEAAEWSGEPGETATDRVGEMAEALGFDPEDAEGRTDALLTYLALSPSIWASRQPPPVAVTVAAPIVGAVDPVTASTAPGAAPPPPVSTQGWGFEAAEDVEDIESDEWDESAEWDEANEWDEADEWDESDESDEWDPEAAYA